jgi:putative acetyltransferase
MNPSIHLKRTNGEDPGFEILVAELDADLDSRYGSKQEFYGRFNHVRKIPTVVVAFINGEPAGCGCFKPFDETSVEIKRMYVKPSWRGKGVAAAVLKELEQWASAEGYIHAVLETGNRQPEAIGFYNKSGYGIIENYGQYKDDQDSICMKKTL